MKKINRFYIPADNSATSLTRDWSSQACRTAHWSQNPWAAFISLCRGK